MLKEDEGCELVAYPDPLSGGEPFTIGYGHAQNVFPGMVVTQDQAYAFLNADVASAEAEIARCYPWAENLDPARLDVLTNMMFNMGPKRLAGFRKMLAALQAGDWKTAAAEMLDSTWATQVKGRAHRLATVMEHGYAAL